MILGFLVCHSTYIMVILSEKEGIGVRASLRGQNNDQDLKALYLKRITSDISVLEYMTVKVNM